MLAADAAERRFGRNEWPHEDSNVTSKAKQPKLADKEGVPMGKGKGRWPAFAIWQAKELVGRDILFGTFLLLTFFLYLYKTIPVLCEIGPPAPNQDNTCSNAAVSHVLNMSDQCSSATARPGLSSRQDRPFLWKAVCHELSMPYSQPAAAVAGRAEFVQQAARKVALTVASKFTRVVIGLMEGLLSVFCCGTLTGDLFHMVIPPLRFTLLVLLLVPFPYPSLPAMWHAARSKLGRSSCRSNSTSDGCIADDQAACRSFGADECSIIKQRNSKRNSSNSFINWYTPAYWWQHPKFRQAVIILQRMVPPATAAASVGYVGTRYFDLASLRYWPLIGQYVYLGWTAWMLVLPSKVHLPVSFIEWLLIYSTAVRVNRVYYNKATHLSHLLASFLCIFVLPTLGVVWLEKGQLKRYAAQAQLHGLAPAAAVPAGKKQHDKQQKHERHRSKLSDADGADDEAEFILKPSSTKTVLPSGASSSNTANPTSSIEPLTAPFGASTSTMHFGASIGSTQFLADISGSLQLVATEAMQCQKAIDAGAAAAAAARARGAAKAADRSSTRVQHASPSQYSGISNAGDDAEPGKASNVAAIAGLMPSLRTLLGDEPAGAILAAAVTAGPGPRPGAMPHYTSMAQALPVSIKVHTSHSHVPAVSPALTDALSSQVEPLTPAGAPVQLHALCFPGCVQLLSNVITLPHNWQAAEPTAGTTAAATGANGSNNVLGVSSEWFAAALLSDVKSRLQAAKTCKARELVVAQAPAGQADSAEPLVLDVDAAKRQKVAATSGSDSLPEIDVVVNSACISSAGDAVAVAISAGTPYEVPNSNSSSTEPAVCTMAAIGLECLEAACLTADRQQSLLLNLQTCCNKPGTSAITKAAAAGVPAVTVGSPCRLLMFQSGTVMLDEKVVLADTVSVFVPALAAGVAHVALLPGKKPIADNDTAAAAQHTGTRGKNAANGAPLLLAPLVVLPESAAQEMQTLWQQAATTEASRAAAWRNVMAGVTTDMAYVLSTFTAEAIGQIGSTAVVSTAPRDIKRPLPPGVATVLQHLLRHLAACKLWNTLQFVVNQAMLYASGGSGTVDHSSGSSTSDGAAAIRKTGVIPDSNWQFQDSTRNISDGSDSSASNCSTDAGDSNKAGTAGHQSTAVPQDAAVAARGRVLSLKQLLLGFNDLVMERQFRASSSISSASLDGVTLVYNAVLGLGGWLAAATRSNCRISEWKLQADSGAAATNSASSNGTSSQGLYGASCGVATTFSHKLTPVEPTEGKGVSWLLSKSCLGVLVTSVAAVVLLCMRIARALVPVSYQNQQHISFQGPILRQDDMACAGSAAASCGSNLVPAVSFGVLGASKAVKAAAAAAVTAAAAAAPSEQEIIVYASPRNCCMLAGLTSSLQCT